MVGPLLPLEALAPLRAIVEFDLTDAVTLSEAQEVDLGHGGETEPGPPLITGPFRGLLLPAGADVRAEAAARGVDAGYVLQLPLRTAVKPGLTATVTRATVNETWTRTVEITGVELPRDVYRVCTAVDVLLNQ